MSEALVMLDAALGYLAAVDAGSLPAGVQAEALRALERAESRHCAARSRVLSAFTTQGVHQDDAQASPRAWLAWQTRITRSTASRHVGWSRRLAVHPAIARALESGELSVSWARQVCDWTDRLPAAARSDADAILVKAAAGGVDLPGLAGLAEEIYRRTAGPDDDGGDDGFGDRYVSLGHTWRGAGRVEGDLTAGCAATLGAVLDALGRKAGPEDDRSAGQRRHDALEEACRRLIAAGMVPDRAGQPTRVQVHLSLSQLRGRPDAPEAERVWAAARASQPGWLTGPEAGAAACDATLVPVVTGHLDPEALERLTGTVAGGGLGGWPGPGPGGLAGPGPAGTPGPSTSCGCTCGGCPHRRGGPLPVTTRRRLRRALLAMAADVLSGPAGLAAHLRSQWADLGVLATAASLPLDVGAAVEIIPAHLRRAAATRHPQCAFPGCDTAASACQVHHLIPRAEGGPTALGNLVPLCSFHHLIAIHRWGWTLTLNPDATTTATSPDGTQTLHSHGPPASAA